MFENTMFESMGLEIYLVLSVLVVFVIDIFSSNEEEKGTLYGWLSFFLLLGGFVLSFSPLSQPGELFGGVYRKTDISLMFERVFLLAGMFSVLCSIDLLGNRTAHKRFRLKNAGEYYMLLLSSVTGMCYLACAEELLFLYISLELATIPLFILCCYLPSGSPSQS